MRVLHVIPSLGGGGAEIQLVILSAALRDIGVDIHIAHLHGGPNLEGAKLSGATLHPMAPMNHHDPRVFWQLRNLVLRLQPTLVQTWLLNADVFGGLAARWCKVPWLLSERSSQAMYGQGRKFRLRQWLAMSANMIVANSEGGLDYWRTAGFQGEGMVIRNIVGGKGVVGLNASDQPSGGSQRVVAVGRLSEEKNFSVLLDALERLFKRWPCAQASILGEGPLRNMLAARIASSPLLAGRVELPGYVGDVTQRLADATLCVSLSRFEGTPNAVIEAVDVGCPLVLSDIPAHREWLSGDEAKWSPMDKSELVAQAMHEVLLDPGLSRQRLAPARLRLRAWSPDRIAAQYFGAYKLLANQ